MPLALTDTRRDWPILLAQRMRGPHWIPAQVELVGTVACPTPDLDYVLDLGRRYELRYDQVQAARATLSAADQGHIRAYLERDDVPVAYLGTDGRSYKRRVPPPMAPPEATAFRHLWQALAAAGHVELRPPKPPPTDDPPSDDLHSAPADE